MQNMSTICDGSASEGDAFLNCSIASGSFRNASYIPASQNGILVVAYNINYNGVGGAGGPNQNGLSGVLDILRRIDADVLLLSEVARGCSDGLNGAEEIAKALQMDFAYAVAFYEFGGTSPECTTGNAVLSRFQLTDFQQLQFVSQCCPFSGRAGGRSTIAATVTTPFGKICAHSAHLESGQRKTVLEAAIVRGDQGVELGALANEYANEKGCISVIGGDLNSPFKFLDPTLIGLSYAGYYDVHGLLAAANRTTLEGAGDDENAINIGIANLDYVLVKPKEHILYEYSGICHSADECHGWSDHVAVWGGVRFDLGQPAEIVSGIEGLSLRTNSTLNATVDWAFVSLPVLWCMLLLHTMSLVYRVKLRKKPFMERFEEEAQDRLIAIVAKLKSYKRACWGYFFVLFATGLYALVLSLTRQFAYNRDYGGWTLFLLTLLVFGFILEKEENFSYTPVLVLCTAVLDACIVGTVFSSLLFWFWFLIPSCSASAVLCGTRFNPPDFVMYVVHPILLPIMAWKLEVPLRQGQPSPGIGATFWFTLFLSMDYAFYFATGVTDESYQAGYSYFVFASESLLAAPFLLLLLLVQYLVGALLRKLLSMKNQSASNKKVEL